MVLVAAIAGLVEGRQAAAQTDPRPIKKIALLQCPDPDRIGARTIVHGGGAIWQMVYPDQSEKVTAALAADPVKLGGALTGAVEARLRAEGYAVVRITPRREEPQKLLKSYAGIQTAAEAILDMTIFNVGYYRPTGLLAFRPLIAALTRLVLTENRQTISSDRFTYDLHGHPDAPEYQKHKIEGIEELVADPAEAKQGLLAIVPALAEEIFAKVNQKNRSFDAAKAARDVSSEPEALRSDDRGSN